MRRLYPRNLVIKQTNKKSFCAALSKKAEYIINVKRKRYIDISENIDTICIKIG